MAELPRGSRAHYRAAVDRTDENGSSAEAERPERSDSEEEARTQRRRRTSGANGVTPVSGVPAQTPDPAPANRPTSGVPARGGRGPLSASPLHEALRGSRSTELPRVEQRETPRPPRPGGYDPFREVEEEASAASTGALRDETSLVDASALRASIKQTDGLYRSTKPAFGVLYGLLAGVGEILMVRPFLAGIFKLSAGLALAPLLAIVAFPFLAVVLYGLSTGAATAVQFQGPRVWLRTPLVYVPIALLLLIAAGAAA